MHQQRVSSIQSVWSAAEDGVLLLVDGQSLERLILGGRDRNHNVWWRTPLTRAGYGFYHLPGFRDPAVRSHPDLAPGEVEVGVCPVCGDLGCGSVVVWLRREADTVIWERPHWGASEPEVAQMDEAELRELYEADAESGADDPLANFPPRLVFAAAEYDAAIDNVARLFREHPRWRKATRGGARARAGDDSAGGDGAGGTGPRESGRRSAGPWWRRAWGRLSGGSKG